VLGHEQGERPAERVPSDREAVRVDLGERAKDCEPGEGVAQLIDLQQAQLNLVARLLPLVCERPVHEVPLGIP